MPLFYRTWRFIAICTKACHLLLFGAMWIQYLSSHPFWFEHYSAIYALVLQMASLLQVSLPQPHIHLSSSSYVPYAQPISFLVWTHLVSSEDHKAPHCLVFSTLLLPLPSLPQISSSAPCYGTPSVCALPLMLETNFHTHVKQKAKL